jgi:hypothetical protein
MKILEPIDEEELIDLDIRAVIYLKLGDSTIKVEGIQFINLIQAQTMIVKFECIFLGFKIFRDGHLLKQVDEFTKVNRNDYIQVQL